MRIQAQILRAEMLQYTKKDGNQSTFFELQLCHGQRPKTAYNQSTGTREVMYNQQGQPMMDNDILTLQYFGSDANLMQQLALVNNFVPNAIVEMDLHSYSSQNQYTRRLENTWLMPDNIKVVSMPMPSAPQQQTMPFGFGG